MRLYTRCEIAFEITVPTPFILMLRPRSGAQQWVAREEYRLNPHVPVFEITDNYGNLCQRLVAPPGDFTVSTAAEIETANMVDQSPGAPFVLIENLPDEVLAYLLPSRFCESDRFCNMATEITTGKSPGYDQVKSIEDWLRTSIRYEPGSSTIPVSAVEVNLRQFGVCRDLAHLGIALCRGLSIPSRMVVSFLYGLEPVDLHAWFEAYIGGRWYTFDATQQKLRGGYVAIGYGRDAADVAIYNQYGPPILPKAQNIQVRSIERNK